MLTALYYIVSKLNVLYLHYVIQKMFYLITAKLFDILRNMFQALPENLIFEHRRVRKVDKCSLITDDTNPLSYDRQKCNIVEKHHLLQVLKKYIFETKVSYSKSKIIFTIIFLKIYNCRLHTKKKFIMLIEECHRV